jgi:Ca2+-transporting ATPase
MPHAAPAEAVLASLRSDSDRGLALADAANRLEVHGRNALPSAPARPAWRKFAAQFKDGLVLLLIAAAAISALLWWLERDAPAPFEAFAILAIVLLNAAMGFAQQERADRAAAALRRMAAHQANVLRGGEILRIDADQLVPGDIIILNEGDTVAADARLIEVGGLQVSESALTGESMPVIKAIDAVPPAAELGDRTSMVFSGTAIACGHGRAVITATGQGTEMGRIQGLLSATGEVRTPLQLELDQVSRRLGVAVILIGAVMVATLIASRPMLGMSALFEIFILGVALAVAAVPEGLPAIVTAVLAIGVQRMAKRKAIVRTLAAVETLGSADVIATDKTGTLTRNEMTVRIIRTASGTVRLSGSGYAPEGEPDPDPDSARPTEAMREAENLLEAAERASNAVLVFEPSGWSVNGDPTEGALLAAAAKCGLDRAASDRRLPRVGEMAFSSERKRMSTIHRRADGQPGSMLFSKGAPDVLIALCSRERVADGDVELDGERRKAIQDEVDRLASDGLRPLGIACRRLDAYSDFRSAEIDLEQDLTFLGLVGIMDPPRAEAAIAVADARRAGIRVIMITGDHPVTARAIGRELGIEPHDRAATGVEIGHADDAALDRLVRETSIYARVAPEHKLRIVQALRRQGHIVAMTGDGVNDAPALKTADIGVAMGVAGTDVAKEAADIILADDNFSTIVAAVEEGRTIFANIRKFLVYLLSSNIGEVMTMFLGIIGAGLIGLPRDESAIILPLLAVQILWINLMTDGAPALALGLDSAGTTVMSRPPRDADEGVITRAMWQRILMTGMIMALGTLAVFDATLPGGLLPGERTLAAAQTLAFTTLVLFQLVNALATHLGEQSLFSARLFTNKWLWMAVSLSLALQVCVVHFGPLQAAFSTVPLSGSDWLLCAGVASVLLWVRELGIILRHKATPSARQTAIGTA